MAARMSVLLFDDTAAAHAAEIRARMESSGLPIGGYDLLIAGRARSRDLVLITGNFREFKWVDGLRSEDWLDGSGQARSEPAAEWVERNTWTWFILLTARAERGSPVAQ